MSNPKRVVLIEYYMCEDQVLLFIGRSDFSEPKVVEVKLTLDEIHRFMTIHFGATAGGKSVQHLDINQLQADLGSLVEPVAAEADEDDIIWFVPHDVLHYLPFHALQIDGRFLAERNSICYTPSASVMKYCQTKRRGSLSRALVLGDSLHDLCYAREEAGAVAEMFGTAPYLGEQATKALVTKKLECEPDHLDVLHFACHVTFERDQPLKSRIVLAPDPPTSTHLEHHREWDLTAEEIFGLHISAGVVVLSGCASGVSDRKPGDELIGLTRALIYAGTPSVIASLWMVDDLSTSLLMQRFYEELRKPPGANGGEHVSKAEALRRAQTYVRELTAQQVIDYYERRLAGPSAPGELGRRLALQLGRTKAYSDAGDVQSAQALYSAARSELSTLSGQQCRELGVVTEFLTLVESAMNASKHTSIDHDARPFEQPYYWAPFVLIGDYR